MYKKILLLATLLFFLHTYPLTALPPLGTIKEFLSHLIKRKYLSASRKFKITAFTKNVFGVAIDGLEKQEVYILFRCMAFFLSTYIRTGFGDEIALFYQDPGSKLYKVDDEFETIVEMEYTFLDKREKIMFYLEGEGDNWNLIDIKYREGRLSKILFQKQEEPSPREFIDRFVDYVHVYNTYTLRKLPHMGFGVEIPQFFDLLDGEDKKEVHFSAFNNEILFSLKIETRVENKNLEEEFNFLLERIKAEEKFKIEKIGKVFVAGKLSPYIRYKNKKEELIEESMAIIQGKLIIAKFVYDQDGTIRFDYFDGVRRKILAGIKPISN
ncbi:hypothetical protein ACFL35_20680 [Candidatus Riflebacteria bacterium]